MTGYELVADELGAHRATLARLTEETRAVSDVGRSTDLGGDAYGRVGASFAAALSGAARAGTDTLAAAVAGFEAVTAKVGETLDAYQRHEDDVRSALGGFR